MSTVRFDVPEESLRSVAATPDAFAKAVRLAAGLYWYGRGEVSLGTAAAVAGLTQTEMMHALKAAGLDTFRVDLEDFERELAFLAERRSQDGSGG